MMIAWLEFMKASDKSFKTHNEIDNEIELQKR